MRDIRRVIEAIKNGFAGARSDGGMGSVAGAQDRASPESGDLIVPVQMLAGACNPLNLEFSWAAA
jgi:hypothetical protein